MPETSLSTEYRFIGGRDIKVQPEDTPLSDFLRDFSKAVLAALEQEKHHVVVIGGESRLGKTEAFIQNTPTRQAINTGGLWNVIRETDPHSPIRHLNLQAASVPKQLAGISSGEVPTPSYLIIDEGMKLAQNPALTSALAAIIKSTPIRVIIIGGGHYRAEEQTAMMTAALSENGIIINPTQQLLFPARALNRTQAHTLMQQHGPRYSEEEADLRLKELDDQSVPTLFPILEGLSSDLSIPEGTFNQMIGHHIEKVSPAQPRLSWLPGIRH